MDKKGINMKVAGPTGWRGVMNRGPQRSDFGLSPLADNVDSLTQRPRVRVSRIHHGIGGGMQLNYETHSGLTTSLRSGTSRTSRQLPLTGSRAAAGIFCAMLIAGLLITHVHLRFKILDMKMQQHALQTVHYHLEREASMLDSRSAHLGDLGRLKDFAVMKLQMRENTESSEVTIATYLIEKYSARSIAEAQQEQTRELAAEQRDKTRNPFKRIANMALAFAEGGR